MDLISRLGSKSNGKKSYLSSDHRIYVRAVNRFGRLVERMGKTVGPSSDVALMKLANRSTMLWDWGSDEFRPALRRLLQAYREEAKLSLWGWISVNSEMVRRLSNRLWIQKELTRNPGIRQEKIQSPIFIVSLPRTGTTLLHRLLALDPNNRSPLFWETYLPAPAPRPDKKGLNWRSLWSRGLLNNFFRVAPDLAHIHPMDANEPEECIELLANTFMWHSYHVFNHMPRYKDWLRVQDHVPPYEYYKLQLQLLQYHYPQLRWVLKSPMHSYSLEAILKVFPDACIIQTHRDPVLTAGSWCSLIATIRGTYSDEWDTQAIGKESLTQLKEMCETSYNIRKTADPKRFYDIQFDDLVRDPLGTIHSIYNSFGLEILPEFDQNIQNWLSKDRKKNRRPHQYTPEEFGLDPDEVRNTLAQYA